MAANKKNPQVQAGQQHTDTKQYPSKAISPHLIYFPIYSSRIHSANLHNKTSNGQETGMKSVDSTVKQVF